MCCVESKTNMVTIPDVSKDTMEKLLLFMYTDEIDDNTIDTELLAAADKYEISRLKAICECTLVTKLNVTNAMKIGVSAHLHGSDIFKKDVISFIKNYWSKIKEENLDIAKSHPDLLLEIMSNLKL